MIKISQLTKAERLLILRRRQGLTIKQMAQKCGLSRNNYHFMEHGEKDVPPEFIKQGLVKLEKHEQCLVVRRREGVEQSELAKILNKSRYWIGQMETGKEDCSLLYSYWNSRYDNGENEQDRV